MSESKFKKYARFVFFIIALLFGVMAVTGCTSASNYKNDIFRLVEDHKDVFLADISAKEFSASLALEGVESVNALENCVNFYCGGHGISASSHEYGFYYSFDDQPLGVWEDFEFCSDEEMTKDGDGFSADFQHNGYYTEKICDNFYYYELHF